MTEPAGAPPVVFAFRPESYKVLDTPDEIQEWERLMRERVGLDVDFRHGSRSCTESYSGGQKDDCDQD